MQRLRPPHWREAPPAARFGALAAVSLPAAREAVFLNHLLLAAEQSALGISIDCAPVLDLAHDGAHQVIGDRAYGGDPLLVADLGRAAIEGLLAGGVLPIVKHIPGHGRATGRQPPCPAGVRQRPGEPRGERFPAVPPAARCALGDDRACRLQRHRPGGTGNDLETGDRRGDPRPHRLLRPAAVRRPLDARPRRRIGASALRRRGRPGATCCSIATATARRWPRSPPRRAR